MDLVSLTNFESVSRDLNKLGETFQQNGYDVEIIFKKEGSGSPRRLKLSNTKSGNNNNNDEINDLKSPNLFNLPFVSPIAKTLHPEPSIESNSPEHQRTGLPHNQSNTSFYPYPVPLDPVQVEHEQLEEQKKFRIWHPRPDLLLPPKPNYYKLPNTEGTTTAKTTSLFAAMKHILINHTYRGFLVGFCIKLLFNSLPILIKKGLSGGLLFILQNARTKFVNPLYYGAFSSTLLTVFHTLMFATKRSQDLSKTQRSFGATFIASFLAMLWLPRGDRTGMTIFVLVRALESIAKQLVATGVLPSIPHADSLLFAAATAHITFAWIYSPWSLDSGYRGFLDTHTGNRGATQHTLSWLKFGKTIENQKVDSPNPGIHPPPTYEGGITFGYSPVQGYCKNAQRKEKLTIQQQQQDNTQQQQQSSTVIPAPIMSGGEGVNPFNVTAPLQYSTASQISATASPHDHNHQHMHVWQHPPHNPQHQCMDLPSIVKSPSKAPCGMDIVQSIEFYKQNPKLLPSNMPLDKFNTICNDYLMKTQNGTINVDPMTLTVPDSIVKLSNYWQFNKQKQLPLYPHNLILNAISPELQQLHPQSKNPRAAARSHLICQTIHPNDPNGCVRSMVITYPSILYKGCTTYLPVYLIPSLIFRHHTLLQDPVEWFRHVIVNTIRSAAFFSNMSFLAPVISCSFRNFFLTINQPQLAYHYYLMPIMTATAAFIALLGEQKTKRIELALFATSHAIKSLLLILTRKSVLPMIPWFNVGVFAFSFATLVSTMMNNPKFVRPSYFSLLRLYIGKHTPGVPSTQEPQVGILSTNNNIIETNVNNNNNNNNNVTIEKNVD